MIAVQKPALNIPPITSQEFKLTNIAIARIHMGINCFIARLFPNYAKALPKLSDGVLILHTPNVVLSLQTQDQKTIFAFRKHALTSTDMPLLRSCISYACCQFNEIFLVLSLKTQDNLLLRYVYFPISCCFNIKQKRVFSPGQFSISLFLAPKNLCW